MLPSIRHCPKKRNWWVTMIYKHLLFIVNEYSRNGKRFTNEIHHILENYDVTYTIHFTEHKRHGSTLAEHFANTIDDETLIVAVGGDGTLNEVASGIVIANKNIPIAYIPAGSGNDFAQARNLPKNIETSIKRLFTITEATELDVIVTHTKEKPIIAVNSLGFGLDGKVISKLESSKSKETIGRFSYLSKVLSAYFEQQAFPISIKTTENTYSFKEVVLVVCANQKYFAGGIPIHPLADPMDGMIDVVLIEKVSFFELLKLIGSVLINENHLSHKKVHSFRSERLTLNVDTPQFGQRDGELIANDTYELVMETQKLLFWI